MGRGWGWGGGELVPRRGYEMYRILRVPTTGDRMMAAGSETAVCPWRVEPACEESRLGRWV